MLSDEELAKAMIWTIRGLKEAQIDPNSIQDVATWMLENQLPAKEVWLAETEEKDEQERLAQIEAHKAEITRLEGGITNV
jgi:IS5 family transposase